ncbi:prolyl oligopeptidase family serine peptidase [Comamonas flocculans]|uniref:Prolyl oligopeptidase family serine peptidase n=1 Tax=Comamonas flocculans TaxID=2597701 RepID=A0A5B8RXV3_9BURK|nr:prolyl oligopeptidase family serine peptidase [Comamonas flocculans]
MARAAAAMAVPALAHGGASAARQPGAGLERGQLRVAGFADAEMDFQLIRQLGTARYGGASVGECLALARRIGNADPAAWVREFSAAAERQERDARARAERGHGISAAEQYLVACNSYRAAEYYSAINDPAHRRLGLRSRACFAAAMQARGIAFEVVNLPWGHAPLPAYWFGAAQGRRARRRKTLMFISGYDGTLEETWLAYGRAALERGYNLLLLAGPGQMDTLRFYPAMAFVPEYEQVGKLALEHVLAHPGVDAGRVALMGISYGGYFATRMAAHEPRIRALIANSPIIDLHAYMVSFVGFDPATAPDEQDIRLADIDHIPPSAMPAQTREMLRNLMLRIGEPSFKATYRRLRDYRVEDALLARIRCPALALVGEGEGQEPLAQHRHFLDAVAGPSASHVFTLEEGAEGHCQTANLGYSAAVSMDWLDEVFAD